MGRQVGVGGARLRAARLARRGPRRQRRERSTIPSRILKAELPALIWATPTRPSAARCSSPTTAPSTPSTPSLLDPASASCRRSARRCSPRSTATRSTRPRRATRARSPSEILPALPPGAGRDRPRREPRRARAPPRAPAPPGELRRALPPVGQLLPPRRDAHERGFPRFERIARFVGGVHRNRPERTIPVALTCGTVEENLAHNRALAEALRARRLRRSLARAPRRAQLGRLARLLPPPPLRAAARGADVNRRHHSLWSPAIGADGGVLAYGH